MSASITPTGRVNSALALAKSFEYSADPTYIFAGKIDPWENEIEPPQVDPTPVSTDVYKNDIVFMKKVTKSNCALVIRRFEYDYDELIDPEDDDYIEPSVYTPWSNEIDSTDSREWLSPSQPFYVYAPEEDPEEPGVTLHNVYMCICNNGGGLSTYRPSGQATDVVYYGDGYKWKFMFDIHPDFTETHLNDRFIPVPADKGEMTLKTGEVIDNVTHGTINRITIIEPGSGYSAHDTTISIGGDGNGAEATVEVSTAGEIERIVVTNPGQGYSFATVSIISLSGLQASGHPVISPMKGHGSDPKAQLGAYYLSIRSGFINTEDGLFPTENSYRKVGLIRNVRTTEDVQFIGEATNLFHEMEVVNMIEPFPFSSKVIGTQSGASGYVFTLQNTGSTSQALINIVQKTGEFVVGETVEVVGGEDIKTATVQEMTNSPIDTHAGELIYMENILMMARRLSQSEIFTFVIEF